MGFLLPQAAASFLALWAAILPDLCAVTLVDS